MKPHTRDTDNSGRGLGKMENFPLSFAQRGFAGRVQPGGLKRGIDIRQSESRNSGDAMRNCCWTFLLVIVFRILARVVVPARHITCGKPEGIVAANHCGPVRFDLLKPLRMTDALVLHRGRPRGRPVEEGWHRTREGGPPL